MSTENIITVIRKDIKVAKAVANADLELTPAIINSVWKWFQDVEILVPLDIMPISETERVSLTKDILNEMDEHFIILEQKVAEALAAGQDFDGPNSPEGKKVDALWKELAGCYASYINDEVPDLPVGIQRLVAESIVKEVADKYDLSEEDAISKILSDSKLRMMLRMSGIDPESLR